SASEKGIKMSETMIRAGGWNMRQKLSFFQWINSLSIMSIVIALTTVTVLLRSNGYRNQVFKKIVAMIPMRDGIKLNTEIFIPNETSEALPILLHRTPYGWPEGRDGIVRTILTDYKELANDGYIFVFQDIRGRFQSEGQFIMLR